MTWGSLSSALAVVMPQQRPGEPAEMRGRKSFSSLGWLRGDEQGGKRAGGRARQAGWWRAGGRDRQAGCGRGAYLCFSSRALRHVGSVLGLDLVRDDHLLHHLVGHARQGLLIQVQEHSPWNKDDRGGLRPQPRNGGQGWEPGYRQEALCSPETGEAGPSSAWAQVPKPSLPSGM